MNWIVWAPAGTANLGAKDFFPLSSLSFLSLLLEFRDLSLPTADWALMSYGVDCDLGIVVLLVALEKASLADCTAIAFDSEER